MLLTNFRKSVNQEQVEGTGQTLSRCYLPLQSSWAPTFAIQYSGHTLCLFGLTPFKGSHASTLLHTYSTSKYATNCTKCQKQSFQHSMLGKSWVVIFWGLPCPSEGNKETNWTRTEAPSSTTNYICSGAPEMQVTEWQNEGEESQGFLSMWQCWNGDIKHNSVNHLVFYSTETQQNFSHISLMRNRHRNHWHQPKIFQSCFKSQLTGVTHKPPSFTVDPKHSSNQFNQPAERALAQQE